MSAVSIILWCLFGILVLLILAGIYLSNIIIKKKPSKDQNIQEHIRESLLEGEWDTIIDRYNHSDKTLLELTSPHGYVLKGYAVRPHPQSKKWMILCHGVTASKTRSLMYAAIFDALGYNYCIYDHRYHGESKGKTISYGFYERDDLKLVADEIKKQFTPDVLGIHGESMGSGITLMYAGSIEDGADFYITDCPYDNFYEEVRYQINTMITLPLSLQNFLLELADIFVRIRGKFSMKQVAPAEVVDNIKNPVLFITSKEDMYIPPAMTQNLFNLKTHGYKKLYIAPKGGHAQSYIQNPEQYKKEVADFLQEIFPSS